MQAGRIARKEQNQHYEELKGGKIVYFMAVLLPSSSREGFQRKDRCTTPENAQSVLLILLVKRQPARQTDNTGFDALGLEFVGSLNSDADFATRTDDSQVFVILLVENVTTPTSLLNCGPFKVGEVLT